MKKSWQAPILIPHGRVADLTRGKSIGGQDAMCGSMGDVYFPPADNQGSTDDVLR